MKKRIIVFMILLFPFLAKGNNVNVVKFDNKIYYIGNDTIGWCAFDDDGVLLYRITDIISGDFTIKCDTDIRSFKKQGNVCSYSRTNSLLIYEEALLYWNDEFSDDSSCELNKTQYHRLVQNIYEDIYNKIVSRLQVPFSKIIINKELNHWDRNLYSNLLSRDEYAIDIELLKTNTERLRSNRSQNGILNISLSQNDKYQKECNYILSFSNIEDNMVIAKLSSKNKESIHFLIILNNRGQIKVFEQY